MYRRIRLGLGAYTLAVGVMVTLGRRRIYAYMLIRLYAFAFLRVY